MDTPNNNLCIHCNVALTARDLTEGWCDACGKRLPTSSRPRAASAPAAAAPATPARGGHRWLLALGGVAIAALGAAAAFAAAR
jgi:hypothetical protein